LFCVFALRLERFFDVWAKMVAVRLSYVAAFAYSGWRCALAADDACCALAFCRAVAAAFVSIACALFFSGQKTPFIFRQII